MPTGQKGVTFYLHLGHDEKQKCLGEVMTTKIKKAYSAKKLEYLSTLATQWMNGISSHEAFHILIHFNIEVLRCQRILEATVNESFGNFKDVSLSTSTDVNITMAMISLCHA